MPPQYLTPAQLVERWNNAVTLGTLTNWRCQGRGPAYTKFGRNVRYPLAAVEEYEAASTAGAVSSDAAGESRATHSARAR